MPSGGLSAFMGACSKVGDAVSKTAWIGSIPIARVHSVIYWRNNNAKGTV